MKIFISRHRNQMPSFGIAKKSITFEGVHRIIRIIELYVYKMNLSSMVMWESKKYIRHCRPDSKLVSSQWETSLQSNAVSRWLGANLESTLYCIKAEFLLQKTRRQRPLSLNGLSNLQNMSTVFGNLGTIRTPCVCEEVGINHCHCTHSLSLALY